MNRIKFYFSVFQVLGVAALVAAEGVAAFAQPPKLTVVLVVDQMRADYLDRFAKEYKGAFPRLNGEGAVFTMARQGHVPTETAPGHADIATGRFPAEHGIVGNEWWDRAAGKQIKSVDDPKFERGPARLLCPTLGDALKEISPRSTVVSLSAKDRPAIMMGGHKSDFVLWYDATEGQFTASGYYQPLPNWARDFNDKLRIPVPERKTILSTPRIDAILLGLTRRAVEEQGLGAHQDPDLLMVSLSATDIIGHAKGPDSPEMHAQLLALDKEVGSFLRYLDRRIGKNNYVVVLTADHGVLPVPEGEPGQKLGASRYKWDEIFAQAEAGIEKRLGLRPEGKWLLGLNKCNVYLNMDLARKIGVDPAVVRREAALVLRSIPAVAWVYQPEELLPGAHPEGPFARIFQRSFNPMRSGDLMLLMKEGTLLTNDASGTTHGDPYEYDSHIPLILMGKGIHPGHYSRDVLANDIAPTLAVLLGFGYPPAQDSRLLVEAIGDPGAAPSKTANTACWNESIPDPK